MSGRTLLSRPRTRIYDANYNISENYYRPALERLDRKYNPHLAASRQSPVNPRDIEERHESAFADEDLNTSRRRAEKHISERHLFDSRGGRIAQRALADNDIDEETSAALKRIRATKKVSTLEDSDFESAVDNVVSRRLLDRSEKVLRTVGIDESSRRALDQDISVKRRSLKVSYEDDGGDLVKWSPVKRDAESAAVARAKQSRDRILDIEDEMAAVAERQEARERRSQRLKNILAESAEETVAAQTALKSVTFRSSARRTTVEE